MDRDPDRGRRLALRSAAKGLLEPLRGLVRDLAEFDRLAEADPVGVVRIKASEREADYAADLLDMVALAQSGAGDERVVEVFVITSAAESIHRARRPIGGKTDDRKQRRVQRRGARSGA